MCSYSLYIKCSICIIYFTYTALLFRPSQPPPPPPLYRLRDPFRTMSEKNTRYIRRVQYFIYLYIYTFRKKKRRRDTPCIYIHIIYSREEGLGRHDATKKQIIKNGNFPRGFPSPVFRPIRKNCTPCVRRKKKKKKNENR